MRITVNTKIFMLKYTKIVFIFIVLEMYLFVELLKQSYISVAKTILGGINYEF